MTLHAIARSTKSPNTQAPKLGSPLTRTAIQTGSPSVSNRGQATAPAVQLKSNLAQIPLQVATQPPTYQIASPRSSDDGYQEIAAIARDTQQAIGRVLIKGSPMQQKMEIASLWVAPEHRQQGVSKSLISATTQAGKQRGYRQAQLGVDPEAPGMSTSTLEGIYTRQGFKKTGTIGQNNPLMERQL